MKYLFVVIFYLCLMSSCRHSPKKNSIIGRDNCNYKYVDSLTGLYFSYSNKLCENDSVQIHVKDSVMAISFQKNAEKDNYCITYEEIGTRAKEFIYTDGVGHIEQTEHWENGKENGPLVSYYPSGFISSFVRFSEGIQAGSTYKYYENGIREKYNYYTSLGQLCTVIHYDSLGGIKNFEGRVIGEIFALQDNKTIMVFPICPAYARVTLRLYKNSKLILQTSGLYKTVTKLDDDKAKYILEGEYQDLIDKKFVKKVTIDLQKELKK